MSAHSPADPDLALLLQLPSIWAKAEFPDIVIAGGMPRSGTSYLESILDAHPQVVVAQEFMPLKNRNFVDMIGFITQTTLNDRRMWVDDKGRHWRGYAGNEDSIRMRALIASCFLSTTNSDAIAGKNPSEIRVLYCKTPSAEIYLPDLQSALPEISLKYVHSIREPIACLKSNWEMPWVEMAEARPWIDGFAHFLGRSADAFRKLNEIRVPTHVVSSSRIWSSSTGLASLDALFHYLSIDWNDEAVQRSREKVDPWPPERRRKAPAPISAQDEEFFLAHPDLKRWSECFGPIL